MPSICAVQYKNTHFSSCILHRRAHMWREGLSALPQRETEKNLCGLLSWVEDLVFHSLIKLQMIGALSCGHGHF